ncbi:hypothetical protein [Bacillus toyonensis]|uniref:hypothetical protein n=1 Tax=Bacillus toyonensis TaxID=155322 RepID=UPI002E23F666|nr:hypothetical protein [Bacillus toyonensis]
MSTLTITVTIPPHSSATVTIYTADSIPISESVSVNNSPYIMSNTFNVDAPDGSYYTVTHRPLNSTARAVIQAMVGKCS